MIAALLLLVGCDPIGPTTQAGDGCYHGATSKDPDCDCSDRVIFITGRNALTSCRPDQTMIVEPWIEARPQAEVNDDTEAEEYRVRGVVRCVCNVGGES